MRISRVFEVIYNIICFAWENKIWWIVPIVIILLLAALVIITVQPVLPFVYPF